MYKSVNLWQWKRWKVDFNKWLHKQKIVSVQVKEKYINDFYYYFLNDT